MGGVKDVCAHDTRRNLNEQKLGEPTVYLKPVEQTLCSAAVPINKSALRDALCTSAKLKKKIVFGCAPQSRTLCQGFVGPHRT